MRFEGFEGKTHKYLFARGSEDSDSRAPTTEMRICGEEESSGYNAYIDF